MKTLLYFLGFLLIVRGEQDFHFDSPDPIHRDVMACGGDTCVIIKRDNDYEDFKIIETFNRFFNVDELKSKLIQQHNWTSYDETTPNWKSLIQNMIDLGNLGADSVLWHNLDFKTIHHLENIGFTVNRGYLYSWLISFPVNEYNSLKYDPNYKKPDFFNLDQFRHEIGEKSEWTQEDESHEGWRHIIQSIIDRANQAGPDIYMDKCNPKWISRLRSIGFSVILENYKMTIIVPVTNIKK